MKKTVYVVLLLVAVSCKVSNSSSVTDQNARNFVAKFLPYMDHAKGPMYKEMMACISPKYIRDNGINTSKYKVNNYSVWGYALETGSSKGMIQAKIWGENKGWMHLLSFKVTKENGKYYLWPGRHSDAYIDPWYEVKTYIN